MTDETNNKEHEKISQAISALPTVEADAGFRSQLRAQFTSGSIDDSRGAYAIEASSRRHASWWRWAVPAAVAAVLLLSFIGFNPGPALQVIELTGRGEIQIDGSTISTSNRQALAAAIRPGAEIELPAGVTMDLLIEGVALYEVTPGTRIQLPQTPGRWLGRAVSGRLHAGELRLKTGRRFAGSHLRVYTPEGLVEVTGTMLSVQCDDGGTCVCVLEGIARVGLNDADLEDVTPGNRKIMLRDGTKEIIPVKPMHRDGVFDFDRRTGRYLLEPR